MLLVTVASADNNELGTPDRNHNEYSAVGRNYRVRSGCIRSPHVAVATRFNFCKRSEPVSAVCFHTTRSGSPGPAAVKTGRYLGRAI